MCLLKKKKTVVAVAGMQSKIEEISSGNVES